MARNLTIKIQELDLDGEPVGKPELRRLRWFGCYEKGTKIRVEARIEAWEHLTEWDEEWEIIDNGQEPDN